MEKFLINFNYQSITTQEYENLNERSKKSLKKIFPYSNPNSFIKFFPNIDNDVYPELSVTDVHCCFPLFALTDGEIKQIHSSEANARIYLYKGIMFVYLHTEKLFVTDLNSYNYITTKYFYKKICGFITNKCSMIPILRIVNEYCKYDSDSEYFRLQTYAEGKMIEQIHPSFYKNKNYKTYTECTPEGNFTIYELKEKFEGINVVCYQDEDGEISWYMNRSHYSQLLKINNERQIN